MRQTSAPLVSVVIATYDRAHTLREAIDSALGQRYPNLEVIVVDDGSRDGTQEVLREYGDRIVAHRQVNAGYAAARNAGFRLARGKYVAWLDSDDVFLPDKTALQVAFMESHDDVVLVSSEFEGFDSAGPRIDTVRSYYGLLAGAHGPGSVFDVLEAIDPASVPWLAGREHPAVLVWSGYVLYHLLGGSFVHPPTVLMRREAAAKAGPLDETLKNSVEYEFLFRLARLGAFAFIDHPLIRYRFSPDQFSGARHADSMSLSILRILRDLPRTQPDVVAAAPGLYRRRLAGCYLEVARVFAETNRGMALRASWRAVRHGYAHPKMLQIWTRMMLPAAAVHGVRYVKRKTGLLGRTARGAIILHVCDLLDLLPESPTIIGTLA
jgi:glycosyltransferase involved in cell wall biosynthesis